LARSRIVVVVVDVILLLLLLLLLIHGRKLQSSEIQPMMEELQEPFNGVEVDNRNWRFA